MIGYRHVYEVLPRGASPTVDSEGRVTQTAADPIERTGHVAELSANEVVVAAQVGQTHDIVIRDTQDAPVTDRSRVRVTDPERLAGVYLVDVIRHTRRDLRILCSRDTVRD